MALDQAHFRFGINEGTEGGASAHGWHANEDTNISFEPGSIFLCRIVAQASGGVAHSNQVFTWQYRKNGGTWTNITTTSTVVKSVTPVCWANAANCTQRLTGSGTFESSGAGCTTDGTAGGSANDIVANGCSETEIALQIIFNDVSNGDEIEFRVSELNTFSVTPKVTIVKTDRLYLRDAPAPESFDLAKSVTGVASTDIFTATGHGFSAGDPVVFRGITGGTGLTAGDLYYVLSTNLAANTFQVSVTPGGSALNITSDLTAGQIARFTRSGLFSAKSVTGTASTDIFTCTAHGYELGDTVSFSDLTGGSGITAGTAYFIIAGNLTADTFQVSTTAGNASINFTTDLTVGKVNRVALNSGAPNVNCQSIDSAPHYNRSILKVQGETTPQSDYTIASKANTSEAWQHLGRFIGRKVSAQTTGSGTWILTLGVNETNDSANSRIRVSVYFWRPGTGIVGYVHDGTADLGGGWANAQTLTDFTFTGSNVTTQVGDVPVIEIWRHATQGVATAYNQVISFNGYKDTIGANTDSCSYLTPPANITFEPDYLPAPVQGVFVESCFRLGPFIDTNGNLYTVLEANELTPTPKMMKSSNGGKTWAEVDSANHPGSTYGDLETLWIQQVGTKLIYARQRSGAGAENITYHEFNTSDAASNPDTWQLSETITSTFATAITHQSISLIRRSNGDLYAFYCIAVSTTLMAMRYKKKPSGGSWGSELSPGATGLPTGIAQVQAVLDASTSGTHQDKIHVFIKTDTTSDVGGASENVYHASLDSSDTWSSWEVANDTAVITTEMCMTHPPIAYLDGTDSKVYCVWGKSTGKLAGCFIINDGTPDAEEEVTDNFCWHDPLDTTSQQSTASLALDPSTKTIYCVYSATSTLQRSTRAVYDSGTSNTTPAADCDLWLATRDPSSGWGTDVEILDSCEAQLISTNIYTHSAGNGGTKVLGILYDDSNGPYYNEVQLGAALTAIEKSTQTIWNTQATIGVAKQLLWNDLTSLNLQKQTIWNIYSAIGKSNSQLWETFANVSREGQVLWHVSAKVGTSPALLWNILSLINQEKSGLWNVRSSIGKENSFLWNIASSPTAVGISRQTIWNDLASLNLENSVLWNSLAKVNSDKELLWNVLAESPLPILSRFTRKRKKQYNYY